MNEMVVSNQNSDLKDDPVVEIFRISGSDFVKKSQITNLDVRNMVVRCTTCLHQINHHDEDKIKRHRRLNILICRDCFEFYGNNEFSQDESGNYNYCTWCGNGGKLFLCDFCPNVFCSTCVRRNFGRAEVSVMSKEGWKCYCCDPKKLKPKVAFCDLIMEYCTNARIKLEKRQERKLASEALLKRGVHLTFTENQDWVSPVFDQLNDSCKAFHKQLEKLKLIGISQSKSIKHVIRKMEEIISTHKTELGCTVKSLTNQYAMYIDSKLKAEEKRKRAEMGQEQANLNEVDEPTADLVNISDSDHSTKRVRSLSGNETDDLKQEKPTISYVDDPNYIAKMSLLQESSSESNLGEEFSKLNGESDVKENIHDKASDIPEKSVTEIENDDCDLNTSGDLFVNGETEKGDENNQPKSSKVLTESNTELKNDLDFLTSSKPSEGQRADKMKQSKVYDSLNVSSRKMKHTPVKERFSRQLKFSDSESSAESSSQTDCKKPTTVHSSSSEYDADSKNPKNQRTNKSIKPLALDYDDPKLKHQCSVVLEKCDDLLPNGETTILLPASYILADLDKEISNLCQLPKKLKTESRLKAKTHGEKKTPASKMESDGESSSSICLSGEDDSDDTKKIEKKRKDDDPNFRAKKELLNSESDESSLSVITDSEVEEPETKKKTKKAKARTDSSDDFQPRKKRKVDKLLSKCISSGDDSSSDNSGQEKKATDKIKKKKRKPIVSDDNSNKKDNSDSVHTTSDSESDNKKKKKKRIKKRPKSSSDESGKEVDGSQSTPGKHRKNIKKIIHQKDLTAETKGAQLAEKERKRRVLERQKQYNVIQDQTLDGKETVVRKLVLEVDTVSKEEVVQIHPDLIDKLKLHQVNGVKFMWECTIESLKELKEGKGSGCILAHCMGLGKTLQVITFLHTCLTNPEVSKKIRTGMVICPYNTVLNWKREFDKWLDEVDTEIQIYEMTVAKDNFSRLDILKYWQREGGVLIISYDIFRRLSNKKIPKMNLKNREKIHELLINPGADIVICDEGHILKNVKSAVSTACSQILTERRIVLTGTPLQNNLEEYHCMLSFVKPHLLGTPKEFRNRFVHPIMNGQYDDSNEYDVKRMKKRIHILHKLLEGCVQRCDYCALTKFLPPKYEYVISVKLSEVQIKMYQWYLDNLSKAKAEEKIRGGTLFQDYNVLRNLCAHPYIVHTSFQRNQRRKEMLDDGSDLEGFINDDSEGTSKSDSEDSEKEEVVRKYKTRSRQQDDQAEEESDTEERKEWYHQFISDEDSHNFMLSGKMVLLIEILKECEAVGDKLVLFSQSLMALDTIEEILDYLDEQPVSEEDKIRDIMCRWVKNIDYFRMDGTTSAEFRKNFIDRFNDLSNDRARLFLVSTRAGGLGTNLVGANRVVMLDASWNPSHDVQAIFRVYRFGQTKPVYIYRLLAQGTMEEKIYDRQVTKLSLSIRVVDEQQIDRHFNAAELAELYKFEPEVQRERPTPMVPKDTLLAEMLIKQSEWIVTYHEHDSLLENKTEEDLTEEERQAAWNEYENEREGRATDQFSIDDEITSYLKEPDFNLASYEGSIIPASKQILEDIIANLKRKLPSASAPDLRKRLLMMTYTLKAAFQEKHVKILRIKQEYVARGSVPVTVNKYLEELNIILKDLTKHYGNISEMIRADERLAQQARIAQLSQAYAANQQMNRPQMYNTVPMQHSMNNPNFNPNVLRIGQTLIPVRLPRHVHNSAARPFEKMMGENTDAFHAMVDRMYPKNSNNMHSSTQSTTLQQPVITEVDRDESTSSNTLRTPHVSSTVVIEEID